MPELLEVPAAATAAAALGWVVLDEVCTGVDVESGVLADAAVESELVAGVDAVLCEEEVCVWAACAACARLILLLQISDTCAKMRVTCMALVNNFCIPFKVKSGVFDRQRLPLS